MKKDQYKPSKFEATVGKNASDRLGTYQMSTGGGTPLAKGQKLKDHPEAKRVQQPRDEDGQFTYNSANKIPLKYGPSRGTTIPPFLRGVNLNFAKKDENVTSIYKEDKVYKFNLNMSAAEFIQKCKEYLYEIDENGNQKAVGFKDLIDKVNKKKGKRSKLEKEMISKGEQGIVSIDKRILDPKKYKNRAKKVNKKNVFVKKPSASSSSQDFNDNDYNLAKTNPEQFAGKYKNQLKELKNLAQSKGLNISAKLMVGLIATKKVKNFDEIKNKINSYKK